MLLKASVAVAMAFVAVLTVQAPAMAEVYIVRDDYGAGRWNSDTDQIGANDELDDYRGVRTRIWKDGQVRGVINDTNGDGNGWETANLNLIEGASYRLQVCSVDGGAIVECGAKLPIIG